MAGDGYFRVGHTVQYRGVCRNITLIYPDGDGQPHRVGGKVMLEGGNAKSGSEGILVATRLASRLTLEPVPIVWIDSGDGQGWGVGEMRRYCDAICTKKDRCGILSSGGEHAYGLL